MGGWRTALGDGLTSGDGAASPLPLSIAMERGRGWALQDGRVGLVRLGNGGLRSAVI